MRDELIQFETAKLAKEKGFGISTENYFLEDSIEYSTSQKTNWNKNLDTFSQPSQSLLQKWLRDEHNIDVDVTRDPEVHYKNEVRWIVKVSDWNDIRVINTSIAQLKHPNHSHFIDFKSFEEAFEIGLIEGLKMVKFVG